MNASFATAAAVFVALSAAAPSSAAVLGSRVWVAPDAPMVVKADFVQGHETIAGVAARTPAIAPRRRRRWRSAISTPT